MSRPTPELYDDAQHVLRYLFRSRDIGLRYQRSDSPLSGMTDSDWAVKHSTTGFVFKYMRAAISWSSRKQNSVALSWGRERQHPAPWTGVTHPLVR